MKPLLMVVCAFIVPLVVAKFSRDQLPYAQSLAAPFAASPEVDNDIRSISKLVKSLSDINPGVLGMAPVIKQSATACTILVFVALCLI